jgi:hypothetical protein
MGEDHFQIGDRVEVQLDSKFWKRSGWFAGIIIRIEPYSEHRSFYWVELDTPLDSSPGAGSELVSVLNPKNIRRV